jgi:hypothetical protein
MGQQQQQHCQQQQQQQPQQQLLNTSSRSSGGYLGLMQDGSIPHLSQLSMDSAIGGGAFRSTSRTSLNTPPPPNTADDNAQGGFERQVDDQAPQ